jgi:uncharacterized protein (UPF0332 family)
VNQEAEALRRKADGLVTELLRMDPVTMPVGVIHHSYYAVYHASMAALLAAYGTSSSKHGKVHEAIGRLAIERAGAVEGRQIAAAVQEAYEMRIRADYEPDARPEETRLAAERISLLRATVLAFCDRVLAAP